MSRIVVPDLVTTNFNPLSFQISPHQPGRYRTIEEVKDERMVFNDASGRKQSIFTTKDTDDFPYKYVLTGIQEHGPFSQAFFSVDNLKWLHSNIRYQVYSRTKTVVSKQDDTHLTHYMRYIYLQNSVNPGSIEEMRAEILRLNNLVIEEVVPKIISELTQYTSYLRDIERVRIPHAIPENSSVVGTKMYGEGRNGPADILGLTADIYGKRM
jgi:hypothetical protein